MTPSLYQTFRQAHFFTKRGWQSCESGVNFVPVTKSPRISCKYGALVLGAALRDQGAEDYLLLSMRELRLFYGGLTTPQVKQLRGLGTFAMLSRGGECTLRIFRFGSRDGFLDRVLQQAPQSPHAIFPADLFALFIGAAGVADAHFINPQLALGDFYRDFRLESKAVFLDGDGLNDLPPKNFIAGFHVGQVDIGQAIGNQSQHPIGHRMPEIQYAMRPTTQET